MEASRQQLQAFRSSSANNQGPIRPVLEEFIPLKHSNSEGAEKQTNSSDKANWMTSVQLWSQADATKPKEQGDMGFNVSPKLALDTKQQRSYGGGAFHPFSKDIRNSGPSPNLQPLPELALGSPENKTGENMDQNKKCSELGENGINCGVVSTTQDQQGKTTEGQTSTITTTNTNTSTQNSSHRKARRCWSPDLHRRFVSALQMLGGSQGNHIMRNLANTYNHYRNHYDNIGQISDLFLCAFFTVATPKQIRELMKVDGLTNDEVKSHLQVPI